RAMHLPNSLCFDLGGGSLEFTYARGFRVRRLMSLPVGALRMTEIYGKGDGKYSKKDYNRMKMRISGLLPTRDELDLTDDTVLTGVGGTLRALARYDQWLRDYPLNKVHNYTLRRKSIMAIHKLLRRMSVDKISRIDAFGKDRAGSITAGSLVIAMMMNRLGFDEVVVSTHGLRDGVLSEHLRDPRSYSRHEFTQRIANASLAEWSAAGKRPREELIHTLATRGIISSGEERI